MLSEEERREAQRAKRALDTLTTATGGLVYYPKDLAEVEKIALQVAHEIRNQYILAYTPTDSGAGRQLPPDQGGGQRSESPGGAHAHRLLRDARARQTSGGGAPADAAAR